MAEAAMHGALPGSSAGGEQPKFCTIREDGQIDNWASTAERMSTRGLMRASDADRLRLLEAYGQLIGNTDRHYGNISLVIDPSGNWALAPAYDTLPMIYAPVAGELVSREDFDPGKLAPTADTLRVWSEARELAIAFWRSVAAEKRISSVFRQTARRHARSLEAHDEPQQPGADEPVFQRERPS